MKTLDTALNSLPEPKNFLPPLLNSAKFRWLLIFGLFGLFVALWFGLIPYRTMSGDDIILLYEVNTGQYASSFWDSWVQTHAGKYRPVFSVLFSIEVRLFVEDYRAYYIVNLVLQLANGMLVSYLGWLLSKRRWWVGVVAGFLFLSSRFSYHYVLQLWGLMEELALMFMLLMLYSLYQAYVKKQTKQLAGAVAFFFLATFTHERYLLLGGFLSLAILLAPAGTFRSLKTRLVWAVLPVLVVVFNFLVKTLVIDTGFTAGRPLQTSPLGILAQMFTGIANIFGFNMGVDYLSGKDISGTGPTGYLLGAAFTLPVLLAAVLYLRNLFGRAGAKPFQLIRLVKSTSARPELVKLLLYAALIFTLVFSASIAKEQELRWLYSPYVVLLLGVAYLVGQIGSMKKLVALVLGWLLVAALLVDIFYRGFLGNVYLVQNMNYTDAAKAQLIDKYKAEIPSSDIYIIDSGNPWLNTWVFLGDYWFQLYSKIPNLKVNYISGADAIPLSSPAGRKPLVFLAGPTTLYSDLTYFVDVTAQTREYLAKKQADEGVAPPYFDFVDNIQNGKINKPDVVATPNQQGAFLLTLPDSVSTSRNLIVISGFNFRYEHLTLKPKSFLTFNAAKIYNIGDGATFYIDATDKDGKTTRIFKADLPQAASDGTIQWQSFKIPMPENLSSDVTLAYGVESPNGDSNADWVAFNQLKLVVDK